MDSPLPASLIYTCPYNSWFGFVLLQHNIVIVKQKEEEMRPLFLFLVIAVQFLIWSFIDSCYHQSNLAYSRLAIITHLLCASPHPLLNAGEFIPCCRLLHFVELIMRFQGESNDVA